MFHAERKHLFDPHGFKKPTAVFRYFCCLQGRSSAASKDKTPVSCETHANCPYAPLFSAIALCKRLNTVLHLDTTTNVEDRKKKRWAAMLHACCQHFNLFISAKPDSLVFRCRLIHSPARFEILTVYTPYMHVVYGGESGFHEFQPLPLCSAYKSMAAHPHIT